MGIHPPDLIAVAAGHQEDGRDLALFKPGVEQPVARKHLIQGKLEESRRWQFILFIRVCPADDDGEIGRISLLQLAKASAQSFQIIRLFAAFDGDIDIARDKRRVGPAVDKLRRTIERPAACHMYAQGPDGIVARGERGGTISFMGIDIDDPDSVDLLFELQLAGSDDHIVDQAEAIAEIALGMMGATGKGKAEPMLQSKPGGLHRAGRLQQETFEKIGKRPRGSLRGIPVILALGIYQFKGGNDLLLKSCRVQTFHVSGRMDPQQVLPGQRFDNPVPMPLLLQRF